eukprot:CAMPEP_0185776744 /NCGR_PEP_ID=MMETSP1174-20130828/86848_1 /TAXON_ID=35687 /ORGANISM="Dictyocha speculum, Strain CCMP1381" /LENGTH=385 /DNA_ID=CAMNT_0028464829 /DNA_START=17 /DNA_END=1174 /DNA_ORIENTATION=-
MTPVDFSCGRQTDGKDPCACQINCRDKRCSNAESTCRGIQSCSYVKVGGRKKAPVGTLKQETSTSFGLPKSWPSWERAYGQGEKVFLIIGEQKCGTTLLFDLLKQHSKIQVPVSDRKELHMFDHYHHIDECRLKRWIQTWGTAKSNDKYMYEATPDYLADPVAASMIGRLLPRAKIIILVRDPAKRAHAAWDHNRRSGQEMRSFEKAARDELPSATSCGVLSRQLASPGAMDDLLLQANYVEACGHYSDGSPNNCWVNTKYDASPACKRYLYKGFYGAHIALWKQKVSRADQMIVVQSEVLFQDNDLVLDKVVQFLGLSPTSGGARRHLLKSQKGQTCWHDCNKPKRKFSEDVSESLLAQLNDMYRFDAELLEASKKDTQWIQLG